MVTSITQIRYSNSTVVSLGVISDWTCYNYYKIIFIIITLPPSIENVMYSIK